MAQRAHPLGEQLRLDRVVHIDGVLVRKVELEFSKHVGRAGILDKGVGMDVDVLPVDRVGVDGLAFVVGLQAVAPQRGFFRGAKEPSTGATL